MALKELIDRDILKFIISQNIDGLHRRSGIHADKLAELHGNTNLEICVKCKRHHMRDYNVRTGKQARPHMTGRICDTPGCGGELKDTIINFGEGLDQDVVRKGFEKSNETDLYICMGSSMRVSPANTMPLEAKMRNAKLVMINLQKTPIDDVFCNLVINEKMDTVVNLLMKKLQIPIPEFRRSYRLRISLTDNDSKINFTGVDTNGDCYSIFKTLKITGLSGAPVTLPKQANQRQPYQEPLTAQVGEQLQILCEFEGHYNEPNVDLTIQTQQLIEHKSIEFEIVYHVETSKFEVVRMHAGENRVHIGDAEFSVKPSALQQQMQQQQQQQAAQPKRVNKRTEMAKAIGAAKVNEKRSNSQKSKFALAQSPVRIGNLARRPGAQRPLPQPIRGYA